MGQELYHMEEGDVSGLDGQRSGHQQVRIVQSFFPGTFHRNFNQFLNEQRLNYVTIHLECSDESITDICMNADLKVRGLLTGYSGNGTG